jgi:hypothetical protein
MGERSLSAQERSERSCNDPQLIIGQRLTALARKRQKNQLGRIFRRHSYAYPRFHMTLTSY